MDFYDLLFRRMMLFLVPMLNPLNTPNRNVFSILARSGDLSISYTEMCFDIDLTCDLTDTVFYQRVGNANVNYRTDSGVYDTDGTLNRRYFLFSSWTLSMFNFRNIARVWISAYIFNLCVLLLAIARRKRPWRKSKRYGGTRIWIRRGCTKTFIFESNYICFRVVSKKDILDALKTSIIFKIPSAFSYVNAIMLLNIVSP